MPALFLDPVVLRRAFGAPHPDQAACVGLLEMTQTGGENGPGRCLGASLLP